MALSNWDTLAVSLEGEPHGGVFVSPGGVRVEFYKNWIYVYDEKGWTEGGNYVEPCVMELQYGSVTYKDVTIQAVRGPQNGVYGAAWSYKPNKETEKYEYTGMIGCGVYGFEGEEWVGVTPASVEFLKQILSHSMPTYNEDEIRDWMEQFPEGGDNREEFEKGLRESMTYDFPEEIAQVSFGQAVRFNQGDMFFTKKIGMPLAATKPGDSEEPVITKML